MSFNNDYNTFISKYNTVGSNLIIASKDKILHHAINGLSSIENNKQTNKDSIYRIASISKVIVALGVMKLVEQGLVDLDEDISKYLGFTLRNPKYSNDIITTKMLMLQSSSISDYGSQGRGYDCVNMIDDEVLLEDLLANPNSKYFTNDTFIDHKPGTYFRYSNLGCGILACLVERVTNRYFTEYIKEELLHKLDIYSGFRLEDLKYKENLVSHYLYNSDKDDFTLYRDYERFSKVQSPRYSIGNNFRGVAGGLYISSIDLAKIMQMMMNNGIYKDIRIFNEETIIEMKKTHWDKETEDSTYYKKGLQMIILDQFTEKPLMGHFGNAYGLRSFMLFNDDYGYIFLCNGANFLSDEEHMTTLQKQLIEYIVKYDK